LMKIEFGSVKEKTERKNILLLYDSIIKYIFIKSCVCMKLKNIFSSIKGKLLPRIRTIHVLHCHLFES